MTDLSSIMEDLVLDYAVVYMYALNNPLLSQAERDRLYTSAHRIRACVNKEQELRDKNKERLENFYKNGK
jgi:hypothetical protein